MGIFHAHIPVFNRCPWPLSIRFDGQDMVLAPGLNQIPEQVLPNALNQHPLMGSQDADNPHVSGAEYLIGIVGKEAKYPCDPLTAEEIKAQTNNPSRWDFMPMFDGQLGKRDKVEVRKKAKGSVHAVKEPALVGLDRND
jgi:hypothetical protein